MNDELQEWWDTLFRETNQALYELTEESDNE